MSETAETGRRPDGTADDATEPVVDGRSRRWAEHNLARRRLILDATIAVLERHEPGAEVHVQLVAEEAGLSRTVIYRHFEDRVDLDRAVQQRICERLWEAVVPTFPAEQPPRELVHDVIERIVRWTADHPTLLWFAVRQLPGPGPQPMAEAVERVAAQLQDLASVVVDHLGVELDADDRAALDPWLFGMIGFVFSFLRRWMARPVREPSAERTTELLAESVWLQVRTMAASRGLRLREVPVAALVGDDRQQGRAR